MSVRSCASVCVASAQEVSLARADALKPGDRKKHIPSNCFSLSLDSDQKDQLIEVIEKLLADKTTVGALWEARISGGKEDSHAGSLALPIHPLLPCFTSWWRAA